MYNYQYIEHLSAFIFPFTLPRISYGAIHIKPLSWFFPFSTSKIFNRYSIIPIFHYSNPSIQFLLRRNHTSICFAFSTPLGASHSIIPLFHHSTIPIFHHSKPPNTENRTHKSILNSFLLQYFDQFFFREISHMPEIFHSVFI